MVTDTSFLTLSQNRQLFAIQQTSRAIGVSQLRLSTGLRVNSALDNPQNFFTSFSLSSEASNLSRVLDNLGQGITTLQSAENARATLSNFINQAETLVSDTRSTLLANQEDIGNIILADNPVIYYRLNETSGTTATNLGSGGATLDGTYQDITFNSGALTFSLDNASVSFNGTTSNVAIPNDNLVNTDPAGYPARSVELTFEANNLNGRQVLYEEGGTGNAIALYLDDDRIYYTARDTGDFGPFDINTQIEANKVYQASFVLDSGAGTFTGYLNGEVVGVGTVTKPIAAHGGAVAIGRNSGGTFFHDGANGGQGEYFDGRISDFALYNTVLSQSDFQTRYEATQIETALNAQEEVIDIIAQADQFVEDAAFNGINLLNNGSVLTQLNLSGSSSLLTEGSDFSSSGLGISTPDFVSFDQIDISLNELSGAISALERFGGSLSNDLSIIQSRETFTESKINTLQAGSDDLVQGDNEEESANLLALQTQQAIQLSTLALSAQQANIGDFLLIDPFEFSS